jgi:outer membrane protein TolC
MRVIGTTASSDTGTEKGEEMKHIHNSLLIIAGVVMGASAASLQLSLKDAVDRAIKETPAIHAAGVASDDARVRSEAARTAWYPTVGTDISYAYGAPSHEMEFGGRSIQVSPDNVYDAHIGASWEIFDFGRRKTDFESANASVTFADDRKETLVKNFSYRIASLWMGIEYNKVAIGVQDSLIASLTGHLDFIKNQVQSGAAISFELSKTLVRIANTRLQKESFVNDLDKRSIQLCELLRLPHADTITIVMGDTVARQAPASDSILVVTALNIRPEVKLALDAVKIAELRVKSTRQSGLPTISVQAVASIKDGYSKIKNGELSLEDPTPNVAGGVHMGFPVWDGNRVKNRTAQAENSVRISRDSVESVKQRITQEVLLALADCRSSWQQIQIADSSVVQAEISATAAKTRYEVGMATNLEFLDAQADRAQVVLSRFGIIYRHLLNTIALKQATGEDIF